MTQGSGALDVADASMQAITRVEDKAAKRYYVLVKDADGASIEKVEKADGLASYKVNGQDQTAYDQSNWMLVEVSEQDYAAFDKENCSVSRIAGGLYNGDACNPVLSRAADGTTSTPPTSTAPSTSWPPTRATTTATAPRAAMAPPPISS